MCSCELKRTWTDGARATVVCQEIHLVAHVLIKALLMFRICFVRVLGKHAGFYHVHAQDLQPSHVVGLFHLVEARSLVPVRYIQYCGFKESTFSWCNLCHFFEQLCRGVACPITVIAHPGLGYTFQVLRYIGSTHHGKADRQQHQCCRRACSNGARYGGSCLVCAIHGHARDHEARGAHACANTCAHIRLAVQRLQFLVVCLLS